MALSLFSPDLLEEAFETPSLRMLERRLTNQSGLKQMQEWRPKCDVREQENNYLVTAEIPGAKKENVSVEMEGNMLKICGKVEDEKKEEGEKHYRYERSYGSFSRSFALPEDANVEKIQAEHKDGVLHLTIPKRQKAAPKKIMIK